MGKKSILQQAQNHIPPSAAGQTTESKQESSENQHPTIPLQEFVCTVLQSLSRALFGQWAPKYVVVIRGCQNGVRSPLSRNLGTCLGHNMLLLTRNHLPAYQQRTQEEEGERVVVPFAGQGAPNLPGWDK